MRPTLILLFVPVGIGVLAARLPDLETFGLLAAVSLSALFLGMRVDMNASPDLPEEASSLETDQVAREPYSPVALPPPAPGEESMDIVETLERISKLTFSGYDNISLDTNLGFITLRLGRGKAVAVAPADPQTDTVGQIEAFRE